MPIQPWGAMLLGTIAGLISVLGYKYLTVSPSLPLSFSFFVCLPLSFCPFLSVFLCLSLSLFLSLSLSLSHKIIVMMILYFLACHVIETQITRHLRCAQLAWYAGSFGCDRWRCSCCDVQQRNMGRQVIIYDCTSYYMYHI